MYVANGCNVGSIATDCIIILPWMVGNVLVIAEANARPPLLGQLIVWKDLDKMLPNAFGSVLE